MNISGPLASATHNHYYPPEIASLPVHGKEIGDVLFVSNNDHTALLIITSQFHLIYTGYLRGGSYVDMVLFQEEIITLVIFRWRYT